MINKQLSTSHQETESRKGFYITYSTGMSRDEFLENVLRCENELRIDGIEGNLFYRTTGRGNDSGFEVFGIRIETDFERDDRVSYYRERQQDRYETYMDMKLEFEPNGPRNFDEYIASLE